MAKPTTDLAKLLLEMADRPNLDAQLDALAWAFGSQELKTAMRRLAKARELGAESLRDPRRKNAKTDA